MSSSEEGAVTRQHRHVARFAHGDARLRASWSVIGPKSALVDPAEVGNGMAKRAFSDQGTRPPSFGAVQPEQATPKLMLRSSGKREQPDQKDDAVLRAEDETAW